MSVRISLSLLCGVLALSVQAAVLNDFEDGTVQGWFADDSGGRDGNGVLSTTTARAWSGSHSLMAIITASTASWDFAPCTDMSYTPGTAVTASLWGAYSGTGSGIRIWLEWRDTNHSFIASAGGAGAYARSTNWEQSVYVSPGTNLASAAYCRIQARIYGYPGDVAYVDYVESGAAGDTPPADTNVVVAWEFEDTNLIADAGVPFNLCCMSGRETNYTYTYPTMGGSYALSSSGWQNGAGTKCWQIAFDSSGWGLLTLSSKQKSSTTGPRTFIVQWRTDKEAEWTDVPGGTIIVTNDPGSTWQGTITNLPLPLLCDNHTSVYVRWVVADTNAVNGGVIAGTGTSRIDDIVVNGVAIPEPAGVLVLVWSAATRRRFSRARQVAPSSSS